MTCMCANTAALNAYEVEQIRADERRAEVEKIAAVKYMDMYPLSRGELDEAIAETLNDGNQCGEIMKAFTDGDDLALGVAIRKAVSAYWLRYCTMRAEDEFDGE